MIASLYDKTATVKRLSDASNAKRTYGVHIASLPCHVQPQDRSITEDIEGGFGKNQLLFCAVNDIGEGDRIVIDSEEYRIVGVETFDIGRNPHMEILIRHF